MSPRGPYSCSLLEHACDFNGNYLRKQPGFVIWLSIPVANGTGVTRQASEGEGTYATQVLPDERPKPARAEARGGARRKCGSPARRVRGTMVRCAAGYYRDTRRRGRPRPRTCGE